MATVVPSPMTYDPITNFLPTFPPLSVKQTPNYTVIIILYESCVDCIYIVGVEQCFEMFYTHKIVTT